MAELYKSIFNSKNVINSFIIGKKLFNKIFINSEIFILSDKVVKGITEILFPLCTCLR